MAANGAGDAQSRLDIDAPKSKLEVFARGVWALVVKWCEVIRGRFLLYAMLGEPDRIMLFRVLGQLARNRARA